MAFAVIQFAEHRIDTNPTFIEVWMALVIEAIDQTLNPPAWLTEARDYWHSQITNSFDGWVIELEKHCSDEERIEIVLKLAEQAMSKLRSQGAVLSKNWLNTLERPPGAYFTQNVKSEKFMRVGEAFIKLLTESVTVQE